MDDSKSKNQAEIAHICLIQLHGAWIGHGEYCKDGSTGTGVSDPGNGKAAA